MAIFEEKTIKPITVILILAAIFVFSYSLWHLGARELFWDEGNVATAIRELTVFPPAITLHGELSQSQYPLYPMLCKGFQMLTGASVEFSLRFVSVFFMAVLVALVGFNCYRADGIQAGAAGATVMLTSAIVAEKSIEGYPQTMVAAILYAGWILWIYLPLEKRRRELAWLSAGLFAGLAFYAAGFTGLIYFILPLIIQSRPLNMQLKMNLWSFWAAIGILLFFMMLWFVPRWQYSDLFLFADGVSQQNIADILKGYAAFPFRVLLGLFPWCFMLWAPFCSALQPLERNPLLNRYFTRLFVVLFVLIWLNPATLSRDILYLMPLLSSLIGLKYWIVVRRHGYRFLSFFSFLTWINMFLAVLAASLYFLPADLIDYIPFADGATFVKLQKMPGMAIALCGIVLSFLISG